MFLGGEKYIIHKLSEPCDLLPIEQNVNINDDIHPAKEYVNSTYPKQKHLKFAIDIIERNNLIDHNLYFIAFPDLHLADVCAFFNNRFKNQKSTDPRIIKLCKFIQTSKIKFPKVSIKNPVAQKLPIQFRDQDSNTKIPRVLRYAYSDISSPTFGNNSLLYNNFYIINFFIFIFSFLH